MAAESKEVSATLKELKRQLLALPPKTRCSACRAPMPASHDTPAYMPVCDDCYARAMARYKKASTVGIPVGDLSVYGVFPDASIKTDMDQVLRAFKNVAKLVICFFLLTDIG